MVFKLLILFFFFQLSISSESCITDCGDTEVNFPFQLTSQLDEERCGYPGFDLSCYNQNQTIITFPSSGNFRVELIDYYEQYIWISDPASCLAKRLLEGFDPSGTPFEPVYLMNFALFNCSTAVPTDITGVSNILCLSNENYSVVAVPVDRPDLLASFSKCLTMATVSLSTYSNEWEYLGSTSRMMLTWKEPDCKLCLANQGTCQFKKHTGLDVGCSVAFDDHGFSKVANYFVLFTVVSFFCIFGLVACISSTIKCCVRSRRGADTEIYVSTIRQSTGVKKGLDGRTIEMYPTTLLGESLQLPKPNDSTCSICLVEYKAKDTLKSLPSCLHYFHSNCIDEWLKRDATCPLCRE